MTTLEISRSLVPLVLCISISLSNVSAVELTIIPDTFKIGLTRYIEVNCSASPTKNENLYNLVSLSLLHSENSETANFTTVSSIEVFDGIKVFQHDTAYGYIKNDEESYLFMNWTFPSKDDAGWYRCEVHGVSNVGHPVLFSKTVKVNSQKPGLDAMIEEFRRLTSTAVFQCNYPAILQSRLDKAKASTFDISPVYKGNRYLLSKTSAEVVSTEARGTCEIYGAHLADVKDFNEWEFIKNFLSGFGNVRMVMIDGTDEANETNWVSTRPNNYLTYFNWESGQPVNDTTKNCLYMLRDSEWKMQANLCVFGDIAYLPSYLCKIEEI